MKKYSKLELAVINAEYDVIIDELKKNNLNRIATAKSLKIHESTLRSKLKLFKSLKKNIPPSCQKQHTFKKCLEEAKKYKHRADWFKADRDSYAASVRYGWHPKCTKHMCKRRVVIFWTLEKCKSEAGLYNTKSDWTSNSPGSYYAAWKNGWIKECTKHIKRTYTKK